VQVTHVPALFFRLFGCKPWYEFHIYQGYVDNWKRIDSFLDIDERMRKYLYTVWASHNIDMMMEDLGT
jgi:hypothetical protein